ncbi:hypothetical protein JTE90_015564 [Oedothorax gibbosus]|uniref:Dynein axonemal assembly factor 1 homolog n=1 Tax=Oedothorax gibbosus TaxID=931172 RepID=A0AAV6UJ68_9ARAC|nr:hypothetical protein JTE90_015564 [Oedothorax gibbosus]
MEGNGDSKCKPVIMTADLVNDNILLEMAEAKYLNVLELKRLFFADIIDSSFVLSINFEHQNLLNIASLWRLSSLTKLVLANNFIKDIESLECMPNLQFLDLSFNCIETINGLNDHLNLLYLNLSFNKITVLENMDHIIKLETFLVRYNKLKTFNNIHYLKQFEYLLCLGVDGNPFLSYENNRPCIIAVLPQLQFLDFQIVTQQEKNALKSQPIIEEVGVIAKSAKYPSISLNKPVCYSWTKSTADKEAFVEGLANGQGLKRLLNSSDNFRALHSFPLVADLAENYCIKVCQVFDKWYDKGHEYYKQMQAEKTDFTEMVEEVQKHSLGLIKEHYELYIDLKEEMPKELCLISQKHTSSDQQDFMVQALKEKYIKEMKNTHKNVMDALRMSTENVYLLTKKDYVEMALKMVEHIVFLTLVQQLSLLI